MQVLFVCRGNIGRSQMAEAIFNVHAAPKHQAISAGTKVVDKDGHSMEGQTLAERVGAEFVLEVLREIGIEAGQYARNQITKEMVDESDVVVVMAEPETWPEYLTRSEKVRVWEIIDPKAKGIDDTRDIRNQIGTLVESLIHELK